MKTNSMWCRRALLLLLICGTPMFGAGCVLGRFGGGGGGGVGSRLLGAGANRGGELGGFGNPQGGFDPGGVVAASPLTGGRGLDDGGLIPSAPPVGPVGPIASAPRQQPLIPLGGGSTDGFGDPFSGALFPGDNCAGGS